MGGGGGEKFCAIPPIPAKRHEHPRESISQVCISAYEFMGYSTVNDAETTINGDRFLTKRRKRKLLRGKGGRAQGYATWGNFHGILTPSHSDRVLARF